MISILAIALLTAPFCRVGAQAGAKTAPREWRAWAFGHAGPAWTSGIDSHGRSNPVLVSVGGGVAASYGAMFGMVRATDTERFSFEDSPGLGVQDYALLAGARSRGDRLFIAGTAGIAQTTPING